MRKAQTEISKISSIAVPYENASMIVTPRQWSGKRIWCLTQSEYNALRQRSERKDDNNGN